MAPTRRSQSHPKKDKETTQSAGESDRQLKIKASGSDAQTALQKKLAITPKTASLLIRVGYHEYSSLHSASPNSIIQKLKELPGVAAREAEWFRRPLRRMVWLATQTEPEFMASKTAHVSFWTARELKAKNLWQENYDDLTGDDVKLKFDQIDL